MSSNNTFIRLLPILIIAFLAISVVDSDAKTCKNKNAKTHHHHHHKSQSSSSKSSSSQHNSKSQSSKATSKKVSTTPNKGKAGVAGGQSLKWLGDNLAWFYDWSPAPHAAGSGGIQKASMMWGLGRSNNPSDHDAERFEAFKKITPGTYDFVMGPNEPDFSGGGSSGYLSPGDVADAWEQYIAPHGRAGSVLISPSMAKQKDETWLKPWLSKIKTQPDAIAVHIFQNDASKIGPVLDHFAQYGKPLWVTEFACINYQNGANQPCNQDDTNTFIQKAIAMFQADDRVASWAVSDAYNGPYSALTPNHDGQKLSQTGNVFKQAVSKYAASKRSMYDSTARMVRRSIAHRRHAARSVEEEDTE